LFISFVINSK